MDYKFKGSKYDDKLGIKDIAKLVRKELKEKYPKCKFSVRIQRYAGGQSMSVNLMASNFNPFATPDIDKLPLSARHRFSSDDEAIKSWKNTIERGSMSINHYHIDDDYILNEKGNKLAHDMNNAIKQYNFDDSDSMTDYFHVNFYYDIAFGKWDKKLIINN